MTEYMNFHKCKNNNYSRWFRLKWDQTQLTNMYLGHTYILVVKIIAFKSTIHVKDDNLIFLIATE